MENNVKMYDMLIAYPRGVEIMITVVTNGKERNN